MSRRNIQSGDLPNSVANAVSVAPILASNYVSGGNFDFAAACAAAIAANKPLYLGTGTLTASTQPYLTGGLHIYGDGPGLTTLNCSSANVALHFSGSLGTAVNVSSDVAAYQSTINVPTTGFAVGNKILLRSNAIWAPETQGNTSVHGELLTVASIVDSTHLTVDENIADTYLASDTASIAVVTMLEGVKVEGFKVVNPSPDSYINGFMDLLYCYMPIVRDVQTYFMDGPAFRAYTCWDPSYDVMVRESLDYALTSNTNLYHYGYGVQFVGACRAGQVNIRIDKGRHAFTTSGDANGIPRYTKISGHATRMTSISFDTHGSGEHVSFANCVAENSEWYGFQSRSPKTTFFNCKARGVQKYGMYIDVLAADCRIINCDVSDVLKNTFGNGIMTYGLRTLMSPSPYTEHTVLS